ncbi:AsmA family protein [Catenovulum sp. 2E275]|uniref:AsmA family protein n=1 Tax=Catenovulum sp. 2E275 TaxID=2980497 RepID=UPI0021D13A88|nr:AsmA family protein [Catenovulum sp. 2E275]MCU4676298.1 AsmA family protein [Catenovulum sp. 2E275]
MKTRYKVLIGLLSIIILFILADRFIDRTPFVQQAMDDISQNAPYQLNLSHIEHSFLSPGILAIKNFSFTDEFDNEITVESLNVAVDIPNLFSKKVHVEIVGIEGVAVNASEQGINQLIQALAQPQPEQENTEALPIAIVELDDFKVSPIKLNFQSEQGNIQVDDLTVQVSQVSLLKDGVFNLDEVKGQLKLNSREVNVLVKNFQDQRDTSRIDLVLANSELELDINQSHASQVTLKSLNLQQADIKVNLGAIEQADKNAIEKAGEEVKEVSQKAAEELIELPLDFYVQSLDIGQVNMSVLYQKQTYTLDKLKVSLKDWTITNNKQFTLQKLAGELELSIDKIEQSPIDKSTDDNLAQNQMLLPFESQAIIQDIKLSLDINKTKAEQITVKNISFNQVDFALDMPNANQPEVAENEQPAMQSTQLEQTNSEQTSSESSAAPTNQQTAQENTQTETAETKTPDAKTPANPEFEPIPLPLDVFLAELKVNTINGQLSQSQQKVELENMAVALKNTQLTQNKQIELDKLQTQLELSVTKARALEYEITDLAMNAKLANGQVDLANMAFELFDGQINLSAQANYLAPYKVTLNHFNADNIAAHIEFADPNNQAEPAEQKSTEKTPEIVVDEGQTPQQADPNRIDLVEFMQVNKIKLNNIQLEVSDPNNQQSWLNLADLSFNLNQLTLVENHQILQLEQIKSGSELKLNLAKVTYLSSVIEEVVLNLNTLDKGVAVNDSGFKLDDGNLLANAQLVSESAKYHTKSDINWKDLNLSRIDAFVQDLPVKPKGLISGKFNSELSFEPTAKTVQDIDGSIKLSTGGFELTGIALDKIIDGFKSSQETSLLDVGMFMVSGPLGMVAMNFAQLGTGAAQLKGKTKIEDISLDSQIKDSIVQVKKADLKTKDHHLGFYGQVDLAKNRFKKFRFGILDSDGCADIRQTLDGPFDEVKDVLFSTTTGAVTSPLSSVFNQAANLANGGKCNPFFPAAK